MSYAESQARIDDANYFNDSRTQGERKAPTVYIDIPCPTCEGKRDDCPDCDDGTHYDVEIALPSKFGVCPACEGKGKHVNPSIDAGGLSGDCLEDQDFMEGYREGHYDVRCTTCDGRRVVPVIDKARCTPEMLAAWHEQRLEEMADHAMHLAEIRAGA